VVGEAKKVIFLLDELGVMKMASPFYLEGHKQYK